MSKLPIRTWILYEMDDDGRQGKTIAQFSNHDAARQVKDKHYPGIWHEIGEKLELPNPIFATLEEYEDRHKYDTLKSALSKLTKEEDISLRQYYSQLTNVPKN